MQVWVSVNETELIDPEFKNKFEGEKRKNTISNDQEIVWVENGNFVKPIYVHAKGTDTNFTEVESSEITEGTEIIIGEQDSASSKNNQVTNPFAPKIMGGKR